MARCWSWLACVVAALTLAASPALAQPAVSPHSKPAPAKAPAELPSPRCATERDIAKLRTLWKAWQMADFSVEHDHEIAAEADRAWVEATRLDNLAETAHRAAHDAYFDALVRWEALRTRGGAAAQEARVALDKAKAKDEAAEENRDKTWDDAKAKLVALEKALAEEAQSLRDEERAGAAFGRVLRRLEARDCNSPNYRPPPPPIVEALPEPEVCPACRWTSEQIDDIDAKIASWLRQLVSLKKGNVNDPGIQRALKEIRRDIAALKVKKAALEAKRDDCDKACHPPLQEEHSSVLGKPLLDHSLVSAPPAHANRRGDEAQ